MEPEMSLAEEMTMIILMLVFLVVALSFFFGIFFIQVEHAFANVFKRPFYIHLYPFKKKLSPGQQYLLRSHSIFYKRLSPKRQRYFEHRLHHFLNHCKFVGRQDFMVTDEARIRIGASYITLTFGMREYLIRVIDKIIIYPGVYLSSITGDYHKGEFNPGLRAVVFSWSDFVSGEDSSNDNINLGIHEFSHALHFHGKKSRDVSAMVFAKMFTRISKEVNHPANREKLLGSDYFRNYAYTNEYEFLAVILEHYFETHQQFKTEFPVLYGNVSKMLNHRH